MSGPINLGDPYSEDEERRINLYQLWDRALGIVGHASHGQQAEIQSRARARNRGPSPARNVGALLNMAAEGGKLTHGEQLAVATLCKVGEAVRAQQAALCPSCLQAEEFFRRSEAWFDAHPDQRTPEAMKAAAERDAALNTKPHTLACELLRHYQDSGLRVALVGPRRRSGLGAIVFGADPLDLDPAAVTNALDREMTSQLDDIHEVLGVPLS